jgi:hypothetical protein
MPVGGAGVLTFELSLGATASDRGGGNSAYAKHAQYGDNNCWQTHGLDTVLQDGFGKADSSARHSPAMTTYLGEPSIAKS